MSWKEYHKKSEELAINAELELKKGNKNIAYSYYEQAANYELKALYNINPDKSRTLGITLISVVSLFYKAKQYQKAESIACQYLSYSNLPTFASSEIRTLLQAIWSDQARTECTLKFSSGQIFVSIKGGKVVEGGAPLDLIIQKIENIQTIYYRITEFIKKLPHRKHGGPSIEIQQICRTWLFQAPPSSYQFAIAIQDPSQQELFPKSDFSIERISSMFFSILKASVDDPHSTLTNLVSDPEYRRTFMKLARNLAPTGKVFEELKIKSIQEGKSITFLPTSRKLIGEALRQQFPWPKREEEKEETLTGILRALDLDRDWLEVIVNNQHIRINEVGETVDDIIGPMVNHLVTVQVSKKPNGQLALLDIQTAE